MDLSHIAVTWQPRLLGLSADHDGPPASPARNGEALGVSACRHVRRPSSFSLLGLAGILELGGGILLLLGVFTRPVAFILSGEMAFAYFLAHAQKNFFPILNQGELAALYCFILLYLAVAGGGAWSLTPDRVKPPSI